MGIRLAKLDDLEDLFELKKRIKKMIVCGGNIQPSK